MSDGAHLLIPMASCDALGCIEARRTLALPHLEKLLARLSVTQTDAGDQHALSMPHERVLAQECGLPSADGLIPWAAWQVAQAGQDTLSAAWAWITPCHWRVNTDHIAMGHPQDLDLAAGESRGMLDAMQPYFEQDGIALAYDAPTRWLAHGEIFRDLATASMDRVIGRTIDAWLPRAEPARNIRRLQQEMQMLLYTHPVNEARVRGGQLPVNSFWVSGAGALPSSVPAAMPPGLRITQSLRNSAVRDDWNGWALAWQQIDSQECSRLIKELDAGKPVALTLCGERSAQTYSGQDSGWMKKLKAALARKRVAAVLDSL